MFFFFNPNTKDKPDCETLMQREFYEDRLKDGKFSGHEFFVYGESAWGEGEYSEHRLTSTKKHEAFHKEAVTNFSEQSNNKTPEVEIKKRNTNSSNNYKSEIVSPPGQILLSIAELFYSNKLIKEVFSQTVADWQEEYFEALFKKEIWKARWINVRYAYAFLVAMWQKSPVGDLLEFISKLAK